MKPSFCLVLFSFLPFVAVNRDWAVTKRLWVWYRYTCLTAHHLDKHVSIVFSRQRSCPPEHIRASCELNFHFFLEHPSSSARVICRHVMYMALLFFLIMPAWFLADIDSIWQDKHCNEIKVGNLAVVAGPPCSSYLCPLPLPIPLPISWYRRTSLERTRY